jgi:putative two-component system response regulator
MTGPDLNRHRILIVDDEPMNVRVLTRMLASAGYTEVATTSDPREVLTLFRSFDPDLLLLDLRMPYLDGFQVLELLTNEIPAGEYFPVLVLTGDLATDVRERALLTGARDFLTKPFDLTEVLLRIRNLLETRALHLALKEYNETLEDRVLERTRELAEAQLEILRRLALAAEYRDDITGRHAERVGLLSALLAHELGLPAEEVRLLRRAATLHDVGKIGVPDSILMKPAKLSSEEFELMKGHTEIGARILSGSRYPLLRMAREVALSHHEKWDGSGYSLGCSRDEIPLVGRVVAVADVFDSLTHSRPYKGAFSFSDAVSLILEGKGNHFDPLIVDAFIELVNRDEVTGLDEKLRETFPFEAEAQPPEPFQEGATLAARGDAEG